MGPEIFSLIGGFPFLPGPLERSSTVQSRSSVFQVKCYFSHFLELKKTIINGCIKLL